MKKIFVIIPGLSIKSVLLNEESIISAFSDFANQFTIYLFDRIKNVPENYTIDEMANDTYNSMLNLGITSCNIFGASQGGMITQCIALKHPNFIERMVLSSTTYKVELNAYNIFSEWISLASQNNTLQLNKSFIQNVYSKETIKEYGDSILQSNKDVSEYELQRFIKLATSLLDFNIENSIGKIKCKTLVIGSNNDKIFGGESAKNLAEKLNGKLYLYENYGHGVYDEAPDFKKRILNFLCEQQ